MSVVFFFNDTATTEIYTLSLHDALPISIRRPRHRQPENLRAQRQEDSRRHRSRGAEQERARRRSEEHTSELQSLAYLVCRLLLEKKKRNNSDLPAQTCVHMMTVAITTAY